jgi:hypothetical protein
MEGLLKFPNNHLKYIAQCAIFAGIIFQDLERIGSYFQHIFHFNASDWNHRSWYSGLGVL